MSKKNKWMIIVGVFLITFLMVSFYCMNYMKNHFNSVQVEYNFPTINGSKIEKSLEVCESKKIPERVLWKKDRLKEITEQEIGNSTKADIIIFYGDMKEVENIRFVTGNFIQNEDYEGCVIDSDTAYTLWKSIDVLGKYIYYNGNKYIVRGVVKNAAPTMYIRTSNKDELYTNAVFCYENVITSREYREIDYKHSVEELLTLSNIEKPEKIVSQLEIYGVASVIFIGPFFINYILLTIFIFNKIINRFNTNWKSVKNLLIADIIMLVGFIIISNYFLCVPISLVPNQWSNFDFWIAEFKDIKATLVLINNWETAQKIRFYFNMNVFLSMMHLIIIFCLNIVLLNSFSNKKRLLQNS